MRPVGACRPGASTQSPRPGSAPSGKLPAMLRAQRSPAAARSTGRLWAWTPRTRTSIPRGLTSSRSPGATLPDGDGAGHHHADPGQREDAVDRQPELPFGRPRGALGIGRGGAARADARQAPGCRRRCGSTPRGSGCRHARSARTAPPTSATTASRRSASTRSILVTIPVTSRMPISSIMSRCSRVCGRGPSSAATISSTRSIDSTPGQHVGQEPLVAGHVDKAQLGAVGQGRVGKAEIDGQPARASPRAGGRHRPRSARAPARSCRGRYARRWRGSCRLEPGELRDERGLVFEAAQVEHDAAGLDAADHRDRQVAQPSAPAARPPCPTRCTGRSARPALGSSDTGSAPLPIWLLVSTMSTAAIPASAACDRRQQTLAPAPRSRAAGRASSRSAGSRCGQPVGVGVEPQHRLERRQPDLVEAQRALQRVARERRDQIGAADDEPGLRAAQQLVAAEGDEVGAGLQRLGDGRLVRQAPASRDRPACRCRDPRPAADRCSARQLRRAAAVGAAAVKPWIA